MLKFILTFGIALLGAKAELQSAWFRVRGIPSETSRQLLMWGHWWELPWKLT
jgi:hypothetical protein